MVQFHSDILFEILSRLPIKSLLQFRSVSQQWRNIIDDPHLAHMHQSRCVEEPKILLLDHHNKNEKPLDHVTITNVGAFLKADLNLVAKYTKLVTCCNGLLCLSTSRERHLVLFNPLRQQVLPLPPSTPSPKPDSKKYGFWFDRSKNTYNIVAVAVFLRESSVDEKPCYKLGAEVYTLGSSSWRPLSQGPPCRLIGKPIFACGAIHWEGPRKNNGSIGNIVSFDVKKENFRLISPPRYDCLGYFYLLDLGGNLAIADHRLVRGDYSFSRHIDIWVMKEYEKKEWVKEYKIVLKAQIGMPNQDEWVEVTGLYKLGRILLRENKKFLSCDPKTGEIRKIVIAGFSCETKVLFYTGSLLSISSFQSE